MAFCMEDLRAELLYLSAELQSAEKRNETGFAYSIKARIADAQERLYKKNRQDAIERGIQYLPQDRPYGLFPERMVSTAGIDWSGVVGGGASILEEPPKERGSEKLKVAVEKIKELTETLERIQKEPLILYSIDRLSKDNKFAYVKKGENELRIEACKDLVRGDEVLLHPKTFQIVERIGKPPLEASRFAPESIPNVTWTDIGGLEEAKADLREAIELPHLHKDLFKFYGKSQIKGILLSGPPGCGKTMLGKAAANCLATIHNKKAARTSFLYVKGPEILNCYVGSSEQTIRDMFWDAKCHKEEHGYPAIIFIDEADAILAARGGMGFNMGNTIVPMFLTEMDGLEESGAIVILATNRPDVLDPAIVRDGRIDRKIMITRPDEDNARRILELNLEKVAVSKKSNIKEISSQLASIIYSNDCVVQKGVYLRDIVNGAMLTNCVQIAIGYAMQRDIKDKKKTGLTNEDMKLALNRIIKQSHGLQH